MVTPDDLRISSLGAPLFASPLKLGEVGGDFQGDFVTDRDRIRYQVELGPGDSECNDLFFERAGPREKLFFNPADTRAAIVTCGGLCPGLNNVIRSVYYCLTYNYGVPEVFGVPYGYRGFNPANGPLLRLTHEMVENIHLQGGTFLGSSRGPEKIEIILETLVRERINLLFCVGGDGTLRGARVIAEAVRERGLDIAVVGIPKTIDNDISFVWRSFGYATALEKAREVLFCAHAEAKGAPNGITVVKLMGRDAGYIAAGATTASQEVNFCLIPEVPFDLEPPNGLLAHLENRILDRGHAVVVVAEGAGQNFFTDQSGTQDASGNLKHHDIGFFLRDRIAAHFSSRGMTANVKYIDPSYIIRSVPANCDDSQVCDRFARAAVHAALAGKTDLLIGLWHGMLVHVPISLSSNRKKRISPKSSLWMAVLAATGQPTDMTNQ